MEISRRRRRRRRSTWIRLLVSVVAMIATTGRGVAIAAAGDSFLVKVVGYDQALLFAADYRVAPSGSAAELVSSKKQQPGAQADFLAVLLRELRQRREARKQALTQFKLTALGAAKWVNPSPDGNYLLVGFEDPFLEAMKRVVVVRASNLEQLKEFSAKGREFFVDSQWSSDSRFLAILETHERWSLSARDLAYLLLSHGVPLETFYVNVLSVESRAVTRIPVVRDVRHGESIVTLPQDKRMP